MQISVQSLENGLEGVWKPIEYFITKNIFKLHKNLKTKFFLKFIFKNNLALDPPLDCHLQDN